MLTLLDDYRKVYLRDSLAGFVEKVFELIPSVESKLCRGVREVKAGLMDSAR